MLTQEARVLPHHIHNVRRHHCFVVFTTLLLTQLKQVFDHTHQKTLFLHFRCNTRTAINRVSRKVNRGAKRLKG